MSRGLFFNPYYYLFHHAFCYITMYNYCLRIVNCWKMTYVARSTQSPKNTIYLVVLYIFQIVLLYRKLTVSSSVLKSQKLTKVRFLTLLLTNFINYVMVIIFRRELLLGIRCYISRHSIIVSKFIMRQMESAVHC